jgi:3-deoxy-manno-octulosonate cytidylyltransferase (CMP-KDO synthetase)
LLFAGKLLSALQRAIYELVMPATKVAVIIPARWGSTRFPGKPLHSIAGKPLVQHVWEKCCRAKSVSQVIVATDDMRIAEAAFNFGAEVAMTSPDHPSGTDRIAEVAKKLKQITHVLNVQGDEPLIDPALINQLGRALTRDPAIEMITAASPVEDDASFVNPNVVKVVLDRKSNALYFSRSAIPCNRDATEGAPRFRHQGIYGYSRKLLLQFVRWKPTILEQCEKLEQLRALEHGVKIRVILTDHAAVGVDTPEDAEKAARLLETL